MRVVRGLLLSRLMAGLSLAVGMAVVAVCAWGQVQAPAAPPIREEDKVPEVQPGELATRVFRPDWDLRHIMQERKDPPEPSVDPFSNEPPMPPGPPPELVKDLPPEVAAPCVSAMKWMEAQGISFPKGAYAFLNVVTGVLTVRNTPDHLDMAYAFANQGCYLGSSATLSHQLTVIEGPGEMMRQVHADLRDAAAMDRALCALLMQARQPGAAVRVVGDAFVECHSGTRVATEAVSEPLQAVGTTVTADVSSATAQAYDPRRIGLHWEVETSCQMDDSQSTTYSLRLQPPGQARQREVRVKDPATGKTAAFPAQEVPGAHLQSSVNWQEGTRLLGLVQAPGTGDEDRLWAAFLTGRRQHFTPVYFQRWRESGPVFGPDVPPGMQAATYRLPAGLAEMTLPNKPARLPGQTLLAWLGSCGILPAAGAKAEMLKGDVLRVVHTPDNLEVVGDLLKAWVGEKATRAVACTLHTVEMPGARLRELAREYAGKADQSALWAEVEAALARQEARLVSSSLVDAAQPQRADLKAVREYRHPSQAEVDAEGVLTVRLEPREVGTLISLDPSISGDGLTVRLTVNHEMHPAPPVVRGDFAVSKKEAVTKPTPPQTPAATDPSAAPAVADSPAPAAAAAETTTAPTPTPKAAAEAVAKTESTAAAAAATEFYVLKTGTSISLDHGQVRLLALQRPEGAVPPAPGADLLWATFIRCNVALQIEPLVNRQAHALAKAEAKAKAKTKAAEDLLLANASAFAPSSAPPFMPPPQPPFVTLAVTTHIIEAPGALLRRVITETAGKGDHRAQRDALLSAASAETAKAGAPATAPVRVRVLNTTRVETRPGQTATVEQGVEHETPCVMSVLPDGRRSIEQESRRVGFTLKLEEPDYEAAANLVKMRVNAEFHTAPPSEHRERIIDRQDRALELPLTDYHVASLSTTVSLPGGTTRLIGLWKPTGKPEHEKADVLQVMFITCDILRDGGVK